MIFQCKIAQSTAKISLSSNVSSVAALHSGFVGGTLISVSLVTKGSVTGIMSVNTQKISCQNVKGQESAQLGGITMVMESKRCWVVRFVETSSKTIKISD